MDLLDWALLVICGFSLGASLAAAGLTVRARRMAEDAEQSAYLAAVRAAAARMAAEKAARYLEPTAGGDE